MGLFVLDAVLHLFGIRGHIPDHDDVPRHPHRPSLAADTGGLIRTAAALMAFAALLSLGLWAAAWLAVKLL